MSSASLLRPHSWTSPWALGHRPWALGYRPWPLVLRAFLGTRRAENIPQAVITFVALERQRWRPLPVQRHSDRPRPRPCRRIVEGRGPGDRIRRDGREVLDDAKPGRIGAT